MTPPTHLTSFSPIFPVKDLRRALAHYAALGFTTTAYEDGADYGFADRDGIGLHFAAEADLQPGQGSAETYLYVEDADALYAEWTRPGIGGLTRPVGDTDYRLREGSHVDPDGNLIRFGSPYPSPRWERLRSHLESTYGIAVSELTELDLGVYKVERPEGPAWVARQFPPGRPSGAAAGDADVLRYLATREFPAERCADAEPVSTLDGQEVLVTEFIEGVPHHERREAIRDLGGIRLLGDLLGRLHSMPVPAGPPVRPGGAWHHLAEGLPSDEVAAALALLAVAENRVPVDQRGAYDTLRAELEGLDTCQGLPEALIHPDFVLANVVASRQRGLVVVDWAGAGRGPRLWPLAYLLFAEGAKNLRRVDLVLEGYGRHVDLEAEEIARLADVVRARIVVLESWLSSMGRKGAVAAAQSATEAHRLAEAIVTRAQAVLASHPDPGRRPGGKPPAWQPFDTSALYSALDDKRTALGLSWPKVADQLWELSSVLNERRDDHPISPSTLTKLAKSPHTSCQHALFMLRWLGRTPESFLEGATGDDERYALPAAGPDRRLRWALKLLYATMDEKRRQDGLTWADLAAILACSPNQLTGLRTAKFATGMDLAMRIVQWIGRPAADFVFLATW
jgi:Ser/Thr protein kinase RdoA (MazF antagonist)